MPTTTLSSIGVSAPINLDWRTAGPITAVVTLGSTTLTSDYTVQFTIDDAQLGQPLTWIDYGSSAGATHYTEASAVALSFLNPIAGLRISSTALSSGSITLKTIQAQGW